MILRTSSAVSTQPSGCCSPNIRFAKCVFASSCGLSKRAAIAASISSRTSPISLSGKDGCSSMSDSRSRQSLASFDSAEHVVVVPSLVACASSVPPTKSIAREMSSALRVLVPRRSIAATKSETPSVSRVSS